MRGTDSASTFSATSHSSNCSQRSSSTETRRGLRTEPHGSASPQVENASAALYGGGLQPDLDPAFMYNLYRSSAAQHGLLPVDLVNGDRLFLDVGLTRTFLGFSLCQSSPCSLNLKTLQQPPKL